LPTRHAYTLEPGQPKPGAPNLLRPHIASRAGTGILTCFPSTTHFCLALGADSPCADERCAGNLGLSASGPFTRFIATHVSIRTSDISSSPLEPPSQTYGTLLYHPKQSFKFTSTPQARSPQCFAARHANALTRMQGDQGLSPDRPRSCESPRKATNLSLRRAGPLTGLAAAFAHQTRRHYCE
jgi:hypothetical protein